MPLIRVTQRSRTQALLEIRNKETRSFAVLDGSSNSGFYNSFVDCKSLTPSGGIVSKSKEKFRG